MVHHVMFDIYVRPVGGAWPTTPTVSGYNNYNGYYVVNYGPGDWFVKNVEAEVLGTPSAAGAVVTGTAGYQYELAINVSYYVNGGRVGFATAYPTQYAQTISKYVPGTTASTCWL
jgi:hypothetical protein